jgi:hypothetical protein
LEIPLIVKGVVSVEQDVAPGCGGDLGSE